jgi:hypothetical protein
MALDDFEQEAQFPWRQAEGDLGESCSLLVNTVHTHVTHPT